LDICVSWSYAQGQETHKFQAALCCFGVQVHRVLWNWCRRWAGRVNWIAEPYLQPKSTQNRLSKVGNGWIVAGAVVSGAHDHEAGPSGANQEEEPTVGPMDLIP